jgi:hypothetical protein
LQRLEAIQTAVTAALAADRTTLDPDKVLDQVVELHVLDGPGPSPPV